jgi:hypothetical protein
LSPRYNGVTANTGTFGSVNISGSGSTGDVSGMSATATGGSTARTLAARWGDTINPLDFGAYRDTVQIYGGASTTAASTTLTCAGCGFTAADVGKRIVIQRAGQTSSTGAVSSVAVLTGGSYTGQPSVAISGGGGQYAVARPLMQAATATLAAGGSGYTNGTQTLSLSASGCNTAPQVSVTVSGGVVTAINSITNPGSCWNIDSAGSSAVPTTGPAGFGATLNLTWSVASADIQAGGWGYSLTGGAVTASMSGGTFTSAATLGAVTVAAPALPHATTIAAVTDSTHATLSAAALSTSGGSQYVTFGHDDATAIQAAMTKACAAGSRAAVYLPGDGWGIASGLTVPDDCPLLMFGAGKAATTIHALAKLAVNPATTSSGAAALSSMIFKANFNGYLALREFRLNANHLVDAPLFLHGMHGGNIDSFQISNAAPQVTNGAGLIVGDPVTYIYANSLNVSDLTVEDRIGSSTADLPLTGIAIYSPDNTFGDGIYSINAAMQNVLDLGANAWTKPHLFNYPANMLPQYSMSVVGGRIDQPYLDTAAVAGLRQTFAADATLVLNSPYCFWSGGPNPASQCVQIGSGLVAAVDHPAIGNAGFPAANAVVQVGTPSQQTIVSAALGVTGTPYITAGQRAPNAAFTMSTPDNAVTGGNARGAYAFDGQVYGSGACRTAPSQVAGGLGSVTLGCGNSVSSTSSYSVALGGFNIVDAPASAALGQRAQTNGRSGAFVWSGGRNAAGVPQQVSLVLLGARATTNSATRLWVNAAQAFTNSVNVAQGTSYRMDVTVKCHDTTTLTDFGTWHFPTVIFSRATGASFATMTPASVSAVVDAGSATGQSATVTLTNDTTLYPGPNISFTRPNGNTWDCTARAEVVD